MIWVYITGGVIAAFCLGFALGARFSARALAEWSLEVLDTMLKNKGLPEDERWTLLESYKDYMGVAIQARKKKVSEGNKQKMAPPL